MAACAQDVATTESNNRPPFFSERSLTRLALGLLSLGLLWRVVRYLLSFPIWGDEALLAVNFHLLDYGELTRRLENCQIAPLIFLWGERAAYTWLGPGELSMRLLPFLAGVASLGLYWRLTGLLLSPLARVFAVGFLAVAIWPVSMCTLIKPYSLDLMMSLLLTVLAVEWYRAPERLRWLMALTLATPLALLSSYPAVFVAGGVSVTLLPLVWRQGWSARCWYLAFNFLTLAAFTVVLWIGRNQSISPSSNSFDTQAFMNAYWEHTFPPAAPWAFVSWLAVSLTGQLTAYPIGASNGGSIFTFLCCLGGVIFWIRRRQWTSMTLFATPLFLNFVAAMLHRYPFAGACRLSQHLAPGICILAGLGLANLISRPGWTPVLRKRWAAGCAAVFALIGAGGVICDIAYPYRDPGFAWMRKVMRDVRAQVSPEDAVVVCAPPQGMEIVFSWYWLNEGERVHWAYELPPALQTGDRLWGFHHASGEGTVAVADAACQRLQAELTERDPSWRLVKRIPYTYGPRRRKGQSQHCELFCFARDIVSPN